MKLSLNSEVRNRKFITKRFSCSYASLNVYRLQKMPLNRLHKQWYTLGISALIVKQRKRKSTKNSPIYFIWYFLQRKKTNKETTDWENVIKWIKIRKLTVVAACLWSDGNAGGCTCCREMNRTERNTLFYYGSSNGVVIRILWTFSDRLT